MEPKARQKYVSCRLTPSQESGRIRWCVGHEKTWQSCLKRLAILPVVLIPIVVVIILVTKYNIGNNGSLTLNIDESNQKNESFLQEIETRQKRQISREERFSYLFKRCYKLYVTFHSEKESLADDTNNREPKLDYIDEYPRYFARNSAPFPGENQGKHRQLRKCLEKFWAKGKSVDIFQQNNYRKRYKRNSTNGGKTSQTNSQFVELENDVLNFRLQKTTPNVVKYEPSKIMKSNENPEVKPCEFFSQQPCGTWRKNEKSPPDKKVHDMYIITKKNQDFFLKKLSEINYH